MSSFSNLGVMIGRWIEVGGAGRTRLNLCSWLRGADDALYLVYPIRCWGNVCGVIADEGVTGVGRWEAQTRQHQQARARRLHVMILEHITMASHAR